MKKARMSSETKQNILGWSCGVVALVLWVLTAQVPENSSFAKKADVTKSKATNKVEKK